MAHVEMTPKSGPMGLPEIRKIADLEDRLVAVTEYLDLVTTRFTEGLDERRAVLAELRKARPPMTYRRIADLAGLSEGYVRAEVAKMTTPTGEDQS